jgi:hypothetical protein
VTTIVRSLERNRRLSREQIGPTWREQQPAAASKIQRLWQRQVFEGDVRLALRGGRRLLAGMASTSNTYCGLRYPTEVIQRAVWLYHCFSLGLRDVELILAGRGVVCSRANVVNSFWWR